jgi:hypothetical protein
MASDEEQSSAPVEWGGFGHPGQGERVMMVPGEVEPSSNFSCPCDPGDGDAVSLAT